MGDSPIEMQRLPNPLARMETAFSIRKRDASKLKPHYALLGVLGSFPGLGTS